jgi:hypothetical protein
MFRTPFRARIVVLLTLIAAVVTFSAVRSGRSANAEGATADLDGVRPHGRVSGGIPKATPPTSETVAIAYVPNTLTDPAVSGGTITVRTSDGHIMNGAVSTAVVSLRSAIIAANANAGADTITLGNGTYSLTIPAGTGLEPAQPGLPAIGDVDVTTSGLTITGNGPTNTTIQQTSGIDRVIDVNPPFLVGNFFFTLSGVTVTGGRSTSGDAGGLYSGSNDTGLLSNGKITITNCVFKNNQVTNPGFGGGGIQNFGGDFEITNSTFGGAGATDFNSAGTSGGGVAAIANGRPAVITITGSTFTNNRANSLSSGGGGLDLAGNGASGAGTTANISNCTFTGNQALGTASGGGIIVEANIATVSNTAFNNNSAGNRGGGIYAGGGTLLLDGTNPSITFSGNTAVTAGSSMSVATPVTLSGTNTTIGGDLEITTNGSWTNNAGSTMSPNNLIIVGTGNFTANNSTTNVSGNFQFQSGTFNAGTGLFNFNGTGAQSITNSASITFNNLTDSNVTQPLTANNSFAVAGTLNINGANAIFDPVAAAVISGAGTLTGTGTARVRRTAATADFSSQYTITNKTLTNLTVEYIGAAAQVGSALTYNVLKINNPSGVNLAAGTTTVNGLLTLTIGTLGVGANTLVINNGPSVAMGGLSSGATGTVNYNQGSAGQNVLAANYGNLIFSNQDKTLASTGTIGIAGTFTPGTATGHTITGSTIDFNAAGAQSVPAFNYNNLTISGARTVNTSVTLVNGGTIGVAGTFLPSATFTGTGAFIITGNTINFNGAGGQTIAAFNYNNLTSSNTGARTLANAGTIGVAGAFAPGTNTYTITGSTINFNGTGGQTIPAFAYNNLTSSSTGARTLAGAGLIGVAAAFTPGTNAYTVTGSTIDFNDTGTQTIPAFNYNHLTSSNTGARTLANAGTIGVFGNFTAGSNTYTITGSTINFNGTGSQNIPAFNYNNLTSSSTGARTLANSGVIGVAGAFTPGTNAYTTNGSTISYNGAAQSVAVFLYNNLSTAGSGIKSLTGATTVGAALTIGAGTTLDVTASNFALNVAGNFTNNGTFTQQSGTVTLNGASSQTVGGTTATTFNNLILNNASGVVLAQNATVGGLLTLTAGTFNIGANILTVNNGTSIGAGSLNSATGTTNYNQVSAGQVVLAGNYNNLTFSNFNKVLPNGGTIGIAGTFTPGTATGHTIANNTIDFNGSGAQTIPAFNYFNLTSSSSGARTLAASGSIGIAAVFTPGTNTYTIAGSTILFNGASPQTLPAGFTPYNNLTLNNATGFTLGGSATVNGVLTLSNGNLDTVANTLTVNSASRTSGHVIGNMRKVFAAPGPVFIYHVGTANGYSAIDVTVTAGTGELTVKANQGDVPATPPLTPNTYLKRFWTLAGSGITSNIVFHYLPVDITGTETAYQVIRVTGGTAIRYVNSPSVFVTPASDTFTVMGLTTYSEWLAGEPLAPTAANVGVSGRVYNSTGRGVAGAIVRMTDQGGNVVYAMTNPFGYYHFEGVASGQDYVVTVTSKQYTFTPRLVSVSDSITDLDFIAEPEK